MICDCAQLVIDSFCLIEKHHLGPGLISTVHDTPTRGALAPETGDKAEAAQGMLEINNTFSIFQIFHLHSSGDSAQHLQFYTFNLIVLTGK